jgi:hypothetical protein
MKHRNLECKICVEVCCVGTKFFLYFPPLREIKITKKKTETLNIS